jgi:hypothetical protein
MSCFSNISVFARTHGVNSSIKDVEIGDFSHNAIVENVTPSFKEG